jgi:hypothetical protein
MADLRARLLKLEQRLNPGEPEVDCVFIGVWDGRVDGDVMPLDGWSHTCRVRGRVDVWRLESESDDDLSARAKHDAHLHLKPGQVPCLLSISR